MDKHLRDQIKHDRFVENVGHTVEYLSGHRLQVRKYGGIAAGVVVLAAAAYGYITWQKSARQEELRKATVVQDAFVGEQPDPSGGLSFKTQSEKDNAALKAYTEVANKYGSSKEGQLARYYAATVMCDQGKLAECEAGYKQAAGGSDGDVTALAKLSLVTIYQAQGKATEAEAMARELVAKPTVTVSKEQAQIALARSILRSKPQEAKTILESLQALDRPAVTRAAVAVLGEQMGTMPR